MDALDLDLPAHTPPALSLKAFAEMIGLTPGRVSQLCAQGMPRSATGLIPVAEAREWLEANVRPRARGDEVEGRAAARAERERHEAELARLKVEERAGRVVAKAEVRAAAFQRARFERDAHLGFAARVATSLAGELGVDHARVFAILDREMREHLARLADTSLPEIDE